MSALCRILGHRWVHMVTVPGDLCLRCSDVKVNQQAVDERRAQMRAVVTFHDATDEIDAALADPAMAAKVASVRAEMERDDA